MTLPAPVTGRTWWLGRQSVKECSSIPVSVYSYRFSGIPPKRYVLCRLRPSLGHTNRGLSKDNTYNNQKTAVFPTITNAEALAHAQGIRSILHTTLKIEMSVMMQVVGRNRRGQGEYAGRTGARTQTTVYSSNTTLSLRKPLPIGTPAFIV